MIKDIVLVGVGGQGTILASNLLARAALSVGLTVKQSEIHGMAQRGGSVVSFVRFGSRPGESVPSPLVNPGQADSVLAFEKLEALRFAHYLKPGGLLVYSLQELVPTTVSSLGVPYPLDLDDRIRARDAVLVPVDVEAIVAKCSNPRVGNVALVGALSAYLNFPEEVWENAVRNTVPRALEANLLALELGRASPVAAE